MFSSKTLQLFLSMTAFAAISSPMSVLAAPRQSKSSKNKKSSKSAPPLPVDLPPLCEGLGDPVYLPPPVPQPIFPSSLVRNMTLSPPPGEILVADSSGIANIKLDIPCDAFPLPTTAYPDDAVWCAEGQQFFRITAHATCLHSMTDEYYYIKYVKTQADTTSGASGPRSSTGECTLLRVSIQAPGTWTEYQTPEMATTGGAIEWVYDAEPVGLRYKFSLCPNPEDENKVYPTNATFAV